jgi:hypothetical protein
MIRQINQLDEQNRVRAEQRAAKLAEIVRLKDSTRITRKAYHDLVVETLRRASIVREDLESHGSQMTKEEDYQIAKLNEFMEQQEKHIKMYNNLESTFGTNSKQHGQWKELAEKEKKVLALEASNAAKEEELEKLKSELAQVKKQKKERREYLLKEIAYYDGLIKEKQDRQALKAKLLKEIEQFKAEIELEKQKLASNNSLSAVGSFESQDLDEELPPLVFKNPNDFPILTELLRSPSVKRSPSADKEKTQNANKKAKHHHQQQMPPPESAPTAKRSQRSRKKSPRVHSSPGANNGASTSSSPQLRTMPSEKVFQPQVEPQMIVKAPEIPQIEPEVHEEEMTPPEPAPKKQKTPSTKKTQMPQSSTPKAKKVTFTEELEKVVATPPVQKANAQETAKKSNNVPQVVKPKIKKAASSSAIAGPTKKVRPKETSSSPAIAESTRKGAIKKVSPKILGSAPNQSSDSKSSGTAAKKNPKAIEITPKPSPKPQKVKKPVEPQLSDDKQKSATPNDSQSSKPDSSASNHMMEIEMSSIAGDVEDPFNMSGMSTDVNDIFASNTSIAGDGLFNIDDNVFEEQAFDNAFGADFFGSADGNGAANDEPFF